MDKVVYIVLEKERESISNKSNYFPTPAPSSTHHCLISVVLIFTALPGKKDLAKSAVFIGSPSQYRFLTMSHCHIEYIMKRKLTKLFEEVGVPIMTKLLVNCLVV